jgi:hypothetical protein
MYTLPVKRAKLFWLIELYLSDHQDVGTFCKEFERTYNFEINRSELSADELAIFGDLFDKVSMFSSFENELKIYPHYTSKEQIRAAVIAARARLGVS